MADDQQGKKKKTPRVWHEQHEKILKDWGEACSCYRLMHFKAYQINKVWSMGFTLPVIIISTITGTANFAQSTFPSSWAIYVPSVIGAFNLFAAIMTTVAQFLKVTELMESHRVTSIQYGKLARKIRLELALPRLDRAQHGDNMVEICRAEYDRLIEQSPPVSKEVILKFEKQYPPTKVSAKSTVVIAALTRSRQTGPIAVLILSGWVNGRPHLQQVPLWNRPTRVPKIAGFLMAATTQPRACASREFGVTPLPNL
jgi:hypothetical protein